MLRVSHFGKMGDLIYALPVLRALSRIHQEKVTLLTSGHCWQIAPLLWEQPYIADVELEDTKAHEIVPCELGKMWNHWRWYNQEAGQGYNLSTQPSFFVPDVAPLSWTLCYMKAAGVPELIPADFMALPSLVNHRRWMDGITVELKGQPQRKPKTIIIAPEVESLEPLDHNVWYEIVLQVQEAGYEPVIVGTRSGHPFPACADLRGLTSVSVLARLIAESRGFIGAHSFPWHLARHSETPAVCLQAWCEGLRRCIPIDTPYTWLTPDEWEKAVPTVLNFAEVSA